MRRGEFQQYMTVYNQRRLRRLAHVGEDEHETRIEILTTFAPLQRQFRIIELV
jgi:hypothetical protein